MNTPAPPSIMSQVTAFDPQSPEINVIDLARALACLERKILSTPPDARLLYSTHERTKTAAVSPSFSVISPPLANTPGSTEPRVHPHPPPPPRTHLLPPEDSITPTRSSIHIAIPTSPPQTHHRPTPRARSRRRPRLAFGCLAPRGRSPQQRR